MTAVIHLEVFFILGHLGSGILERAKRAKPVMIGQSSRARLQVQRKAISAQEDERYASDCQNSARSKILIFSMYWASFTCSRLFPDRPALASARTPTTALLVFENFPRVCTCLLRCLMKYQHVGAVEGVLIWCETYPQNSLCFFPPCLPECHSD